MFAKVCSATLSGIDARLVEVECDVQPGVTSFDVVGLPEQATRELRLRVRSAFRQSGWKFPEGRVVVNVTPVDLRKNGNCYDLPLALALLCAEGTLSDEIDGWLVLGELALNGVVRPVRGALAAAELAKSLGRGVMVPEDNASEAASIEGVEVRAAWTLKEVVTALTQGATWPAVPHAPSLAKPQAPCFSEVRGHAVAKRALEIAAAGGHHVAMIGSPGCGKTMLARRIPSILPPLDPGEAIEVTKVWSASGLVHEHTGLAQQRPFRAPHHTVCAAALVGGGSTPVPGEVSLAHRGVLFLDELAEFPRHVLECLRQPLEDGQVTITRAREVARFPSQVMLVSALNPCPCGYFGSGTRGCTCSPVSLERYRARLPKALLDQVGIQVKVPTLATWELRDVRPGETSEVIRERVCAARQRQAERFGAGITNATVAMSVMRERSPLTVLAHDLLLRAMDQLGWSGSAHDQIWRVARSIADLAGKENIEVEHVAEALQYRWAD